jgi:membrane protease YdiL (CAAX protease family)
LIGLSALSALALGILLKPSFSLQTVGIWLTWSAAILAFITPVVALAVWRSKPNTSHDIGLALGVWFMDFSCLLLMSRLPIFSNLEWNWTGKAFAIVISLTFIGLWQGIGWNEIGFAGLRKGSWLPFLGLALLWLSLSGLQSVEGSTKIESLLFNLTMPAIDEEIVFRGIILSLFNRAFGTPWKVLGASVGWGWIISSVLFGLVHGVGFDQSQFQFSIAPIIFTGIGGLIMGWARERTGSLYPPMVLHSMGDSTSLIINALVT